MKTSLAAIALAALISLAAGCSDPNWDVGRPAWDHGRAQAMETYATRSYFEEQIQSGSVAQHTIYPHHFQANSAQFNELGGHEIAVLASAYKVGPGKLAIRRGDESDALYAARTAAVTDALAKCGVDTKRMTVSDELPGGPGDTADHVLVLRAAQNVPGSSSGYSSGAPSSTGSSVPTGSAATGAGR